MTEDIQKLLEENERLIKLNAVKSEIVSIGAHQIRTSLAALKWIIKMFLDGDLGKLTSEQETLLRRAYEGNERSIGLVSEILLINKSEDVVEKEYIFENTNLIDTIENTIFSLPSLLISNISSMSIFSLSELKFIEICLLSLSSSNETALIFAQELILYLQTNSSTVEKSSFFASISITVKNPCPSTSLPSCKAFLASLSRNIM